MNEFMIDPGSTPAAWPPMLVGALLGVLVMLTLVVANRTLGASSAYATIAGLIGRALAPRHTQSLGYFKKKTPALDWGLMLVTGVVAGAFLAAWSGGELTGRWLPPMWVARFGPEVWPRLATAFAGGVLMAFGARLAGGCTSGHGISGTLQLSVGSWLSVICFFLGGMAVAFPIYRW